MRSLSFCLVLSFAMPFLSAQTQNTEAPPQNTETKSAPATEARGMPPRATPGDYQAHAQAGTLTIAAEFMGHSIPRPEGPLSTEDYIVVETGLFGSPDARVKLSTEDFSLRINGKKTLLSSQPYGLVARSLRDPEWAPPTPPESSKSKSSFGTGGQGADANMPPPPVHIPIELQRSMTQYIQKASLREGDRTLPEAGLLFFEFRAKTKSIHSIELIYTGPAGKVTLPLQP